MEGRKREKKKKKEKEITYTELSQAVTFSVTVRFNSGWANNHATTPAVSSSLNWSQTFFLGAVISTAPAPAQDVELAVLRCERRISLFPFRISDMSFLPWPFRTHAALGSGDGRERPPCANRPRVARERVTAEVADTPCEGLMLMATLGLLVGKGSKKVGKRAGGQLALLKKLSRCRGAAKKKKKIGKMDRGAGVGYLSNIESHYLGR